MADRADTAVAAQHGVKAAEGVEFRAAQVLRAGEPLRGSVVEEQDDGAVVIVVLVPKSISASMARGGMPRCWERTAAWWVRRGVGMRSSVGGMDG